MMKNYIIALLCVMSISLQAQLKNEKPCGFVNGKQSGTCKFFNENGTLKEISNWKEGLQIGPYIYYDEKGNKKEEGNYVFKKGRLLLDGKFIKYHPNGNILISLTYKEGLEEGEYKDYYENGKLNAIGNMKNGKREGVWKTYYETGIQDTTESYSAGIKKGEFLFNNQQGKLVERAIYTDDNNVTFTIYNPADGSVKSEGVIVNGVTTVNKTY